MHFPRLIVLSLAAILGCAPVQERDPRTAEDSKLERFFDAYLEFQFEASPTMATALGDHRFDAGLDDLSPAAFAAMEEGYASFLARLRREIDRSSLSSAGRADRDMIENDIQGNLFTLRAEKPFQRNPLLYGSLVSEPVYVLLKRDFAPLDERVKHAMARMRKIPKVLENARANLKDPPRPHVDVAIARNQGAIKFYEEGLADFVKGASLASQALEEGKKLAQALREYQAWLEKDLAPRATGDWKLGRKLWEEKLKYTLNSSLSAREIQDRARSEFDRVRAEMYEVAKGLWKEYFPGQSLPAGADALQETVKAVIDKVSQEHSTREGIVKDARDLIQDLRRFIREKDLIELPDPDRLNVIEMPEFQAGVALAYLDAAPPLEPEGQSFYAIEPFPASWSDADVESRLREYNKHMLKILSIHEGYPGHYLQLEYSNRFPSKTRRIIGNGPMIEGWAVYTERMMVENGYGDFDPRLKLNQLKFYLRAIVNALIDQGLHSGEMTEEAALALMKDGGFQEAKEAEQKLVRARVTSTQLSTYFTGFQEVYSLFDETRRAEGSAFSLKRFHTRFLSQGSPPVRAIRQTLLGK